jgi:hypothetical protein
VSDDLGNTGLFSETVEGIYRPAGSDFFGVAGRQYVLHIELPDGRLYMSDSCLFQDVPPIEKLEWQPAEIPTQDNTGWQYGVEIRLWTHDPENSVQHYHWTFEEIWEESIPFPIKDIYLGDGEFERVYNPDICYRQGISSEIMIRSTQDQEESMIQDYPLVFISNETARLAREYRIEVKQYRLSDADFAYFSQLKEITGQNGTIFDKQPHSLIGNIHSTRDPSETVMGYFTVSGVSEGTVTIKREEIPYQYRGTNYNNQSCLSNSRTVNINPTTDLERVFNVLMPRWGLVLVSRIWQSPPEDAEDQSMIMVGLQFAPPECTQCAGTLEKPEDWD